MFAVVVVACYRPSLCRAVSITGKEGTVIEIHKQLTHLTLVWKGKARSQHIHLHRWWTRIALISCRRRKKKERKKLRKGEVDRILSLQSTLDKQMLLWRKCSSFDFPFDFLFLYSSFRSTTTQQKTHFSYLITIV